MAPLYISLKVALFFRIYENEDFRYVLKTDDDCFVDVLKIYADLPRHKNVTKLWWGR